MKRVVTAILGGGQGARLFPLTRDRAKPAVPVGGKFRLIDIPISNSLHAGIDRVYVLTQFNSASLHRHISQTYRFDVFRGGFVDVLAAEQNLTNRDWYQGTADAVRQNLPRLNRGSRLGDPHPLRRPALPHGPARTRRVPPRARCRPDDRSEAGEQARGFGIRRAPSRPYRSGGGVRREAERGRAARQASARRRDPGRPAPPRPARVLPGQHGNLRLQARGARGAALRHAPYRLRSRGDPGCARRQEGLRLSLHGVLGRHRDHPELPPGQPRPDATAPARSTSTAPTSASSPTPASCRERRSPSAWSTARCSARAASSPARESPTRSSASAPWCAPAR